MNPHTASLWLASVLGPLVTMGVLGCDHDDRSTNAPRAAAPESKLELADRLHRQGKTAEALTIVKQQLIATPEDAEALSLATKLHDALGQYCQAGDLAHKIAESQRDGAEKILIRAFTWHLRCGNYSAAEADLNEAVQRAPDDAQVRRLLAQLLNAQGRRVEARRHVVQLIRLGDFQQLELLSLIDLSGPFSLVSYGDLIDNTKTSLFQLGQARFQLASSANPTDLLATLQQLREAFPESTTVAAFQGRALGETGRLNDLPQWRNNLPAGIEQEPEYWRATGVWLASRQRHDEAIRAFGEAVKRDPTDRRSMRGMIASLEATDRKNESVKVRDRLLVLDRIFEISKDADAEQSEWIAHQLQQFTRPWEAIAWLAYAANQRGDLYSKGAELQQRQEAILAWETGATDNKISGVRLLHTLGFSIDQFPTPDLNGQPAPLKQPIANQDSSLKFQDVASDLGLTATFQSGYPADGNEFLIYQANGGGIAALDFDLDGRCDIYLSQSGGTPHQLDSAANQLFRLLEQGFDEVTLMSATGDRGYGQGVCSGDVNQDGFPDLVVGNIGNNVLLINQGDGSFRDASQQMDVNVKEWTSSVGVADLDGDHLPEIIEINYIDDADAYRIKCRGQEINCKPQRFRPAVDRLHRSNGDGTFSVWPAMQAFGELPNYGFGLMIANFDRQHGNDVFISNDGDVNHFWISEPERESANRFRMLESATISGCSVGTSGITEACMGIAAGDYNRDGRLDLHVTNFQNQSDNLFMQTNSGFFSDEAVNFGLTGPSIEMLGFGTQAADFDNDGWTDLAVLNGHIYNATYANIPFQMPAQLFRGSRQGFTLQNQISAGNYWQRKQLGRTLATLDFDRDGQIDLVANHLDQPIALLQNNSPENNWLQLELIGVRSERDAVGAEIQFTAGSESWTAWQTGGDGYMCSNEPLIHVGIGQADMVDRMIIRWPSGETQDLSGIKPNSRILVVEGEAGFQREP